jgi:hypothetical protein
MMGQPGAGQEATRMMMTKRVIAITHQRGLDVDRMTGVNPSKKRRHVRPRFTMLNKTRWKSKNENRAGNQGRDEGQIGPESGSRQDSPFFFYHSMSFFADFDFFPHKNKKTARKGHPARIG